MIVTVVEQVAVLPHPSVAVNNIVVNPVLYVVVGVAVVPLSVVAPDFIQVNVIAPLQLSVAVAVGLVYADPWQKNNGEGHAIVGGV